MLFSFKSLCLRLGGALLCWGLIGFVTGLSVWSDKTLFVERAPFQLDRQLLGK